MYTTTTLVSQYSANNMVLKLGKEE